MSDTYTDDEGPDLTEEQVAAMQDEAEPSVADRVVAAAEANATTGYTDKTEPEDAPVPFGVGADPNTLGAIAAAAEQASEDN